jgi:hypothetical protein
MRNNRSTTGKPDNPMLRHFDKLNATLRSSTGKPNDRGKYQPQNFNQGSA